MLNKELIPALAEAWCVPLETAWIIDRSLANGGLRRKWKGPRPPHMTRREALHFLIACMVAIRATKASEEAGPMIKAAGRAPIRPCAPEDDEAVKQYPSDVASIRFFELVDPLLTPFKFKKVNRFLDPVDSVSLVDFLLALCHLLETGAYSPDPVRFQTSVNRPYAQVTIQRFALREVWEDGSFDFFPDVADEGHMRKEAGIRRSAVVSGLALMAIIKRTADPLAADAGPLADWKGAA